MELITHSRMRMMLNCPYAEQLRYGQQLVPKAHSMPRLLGSAVHKGLETGNIEKALALFDQVSASSQDEQDQLDLDRAICRSMLAGAEKAFSPLGDLQPELEFRMPIINPATGRRNPHFQLAGKMDGLCTKDGETWLLEYKTASMVDARYLNRLRLDGQITLYMYAAQRLLGHPVAGVIYRIIRKPSIKQRSNEAFSQYCRRLEDDYRARPEFYFTEQLLYRSQDDLQLFEQELWGLTRRMLWEKKNGICQRNTSRCTDYGNCEYMPICLQETGWQGMYEQKAPNEELNGGNDDNEPVT